ncbi:MAG: flagellar hook-basal body complex protein FliE [Lachnospiraceae bacterium]|nr:flagellar hook-basal body complex protein FliE [Lachnospiraceae bacterium]
MDTINSAYTAISNEYNKIANGTGLETIERDNGFQQVFQSALDMVNETSDMQNKAESAEIQFALGLSNNTHDLQIAQQKANIALQYTVAVRDKAIDAYKEIMNMQI